jgi:NADPH:quinone reductase-like Zn-dependent oxidoreductase
MKAIILKDFGGIEQLQPAELPIPGIGEGEVLVAVKAISINPTDVKTREGRGVAARFKGADPMILGWDMAGVVQESNSPAFEVGDEVFGMVNFPGQGKVYAEYVAAPADQLAIKPAGVSFPKAAATTLVALTAWQAFADHSKLRAGQRILIHAAAGGVGHFAVQIAKHAGAYVIGTASAANREFVLGLGADVVIDYTEAPFEDVVKDVDLVLDTIGGDNIERSLKVMKKGATIISIPSGANDGVKEKAAAKGMIGVSMMVQSSGEDMEHLASLLEEGVLKPEVSKVFPLEKMGEAHEQVASHKTRGKVIVTVNQ